MIILTILFSISLFSPASASTNHSHNNEEEDISIQYIPCPGGGKHLMTPRGKGYVNFSDGTPLFSGHLYQCKNCETAVVMDYNPLYTPKNPYPGNYVTDTLPHQADKTYTWKTKNKLSYAGSWSTGIFASITFTK